MNALPKLNPPVIETTDDFRNSITVSNATAVFDPDQWLHVIYSAGLTSDVLMDVAKTLAVEEELTADMVSYRKNVTGLDNTVFISVKFPRHSPRIKVAVDPATHVDPMGNNASVSIADGHVVADDLSARDLAQVQKFIELNREVLMDYWEKRIDTDELRQRLQKI